LIPRQTFSGSAPLSFFLAPATSKVAWRAHHKALTTPFLGDESSRNTDPIHSRVTQSGVSVDNNSQSVIACPARPPPRSFCVASAHQVGGLLWWAVFPRHTCLPPPPGGSHLPLSHLIASPSRTRILSQENPHAPTWRGREGKRPDPEAYFFFFVA
jgi:hypothetical protein